MKSRCKKVPLYLRHTLIRCQVLRRWFLVKLLRSHFVRLFPTGQCTVYHLCFVYKLLSHERIGGASMGIRCSADTVFGLSFRSKGLCM
jgi:hypothetical protein